MLVLAGNPVMSGPGGRRLDEAMDGLDFMVSIDGYVTETSRHADVILPPVSVLERGEVDVVFPLVSVRNTVRWNPAAVPKQEDGKEDWEILNGLTSRLGGGLVTKRRGASLAARVASPSRIVETAIATGPYGVLRRGPFKGLTLRKIKNAKHGIDLGPLQPRLPGALMTADDRVALAPPAFMEAAAELEEQVAARDRDLGDGFDLTLIGRRNLRSNNSWMHNSRRLTKGADRCTAMLHPDDAASRGLAAGAQVKVISRVGEIEVPLEVTEEIRPGVVSVPHGYGHGHREGVGWRHAASLPGASVNDITDPAVTDAVTGNAAFNNVAVRVEAI
jgi:anaerobic selenocysteine-containing dehydrogenase